MSLAPYDPQAETALVQATQSLAQANQGVMRMEFRPEQLQLLKQQYFVDHTEDEFAIALNFCRASGLNPFNREVYSWITKSKDKDGKERRTRTTAVGIDGYVKIAKTQGYVGHTSPQWAGEDGVWQSVWTKPVKGPHDLPVAGKIGVYVKGAARPSETVIYLADFAKTGKDYKSGEVYLVGQWKERPMHMATVRLLAHALKSTYGTVLSCIEFNDGSPPEPAGFGDDYTDVAARTEAHPAGTQPTLLTTTPEPTVFATDPVSTNPQTAATPETDWKAELKRVATETQAAFKAAGLEGTFADYAKTALGRAPRSGNVKDAIADLEAIAQAIQAHTAKAAAAAPQDELQLDNDPFESEK